MGTKYLQKNIDRFVVGVGGGVGCLSTGKKRFHNSEQSLSLKQVQPLITKKQQETTATQYYLGNLDKNHTEQIKHLKRNQGEQ